MGKLLKRLDNHLTRSHKGVTRAMNDRQPPRQFASHSKGVVCRFPNCQKEVLHLDKHVKNMHALTMRDYYLKLETEAENASEDYGVAEIESKDDHVAKKESKDDVAKNDSKVVDKNETKYDVPENEDYDVAEDASEDDDVAEDASEDDDVANNASKDDDVANNESKGDDVLRENESEDYDVAENTSEDDDVAEIESKDDVAENGRDIRINNKAAGYLLGRQVAFFGAQFKCRWPSFPSHFYEQISQFASIF